MFQIFVDSATNLPAVIAKQYNIHVISFINLVSMKEITCHNPDLSPETALINTNPAEYP